MQIQELLTLPEFSGFRLLSGSGGVTKDISSVNVIDSPDSYRYFKGGELLLTNTYIMKDDTEILGSLIASCCEVGSAAIGLKLGRFLQTVPQAYIDLSNRLNFPLISIPLEFAFVDIINRVLTELVNRQNVQLKFSERVHTAFTTLALQGGTVQQIIDSLSEILGQEVLYWDSYFERLFQSGRAAPLPLQAAPEDLPRLMVRCDSAVQEVDGTQYGCLLIGGPGPEEPSQQINRSIAVQHAGTVLKLRVQLEISNRQIESRHHDEFVQDLLLERFVSLSQVRARAEACGWVIRGGVIVLAVEFLHHADALPRNIDYLLGRQVQAQYQGAMYTKLGNQIIFLISCGRGAAEEILRTLKRFCRQMLSELENRWRLQARIGIGSPHATLLDTHKSYREAQNAVRVAEQLGFSVSCHQDLGLFRLLQSCDRASAEAYLDRYIRVLQRYDEKHRTEYLETLRQLSDHDWNLQETARAMYLHYNTIRNRCAHLSEILGVNLKRGDVRVELAVALRLLALQ